MDELKTREDVKQWMLEQQLGRRNLTETERYEIVQKFKDFFQKKAKENQSSGGKGLTNLSKVNTRKEMAKATGVSEGTYNKLDKIMQSDNEEIKQKVRKKELSIDKAYQEMKSSMPKEKESITPEQKIVEFDNRMNEIDREISSLKTERESLMRRRRSLFESLDIPCELKYEFFIEDDNFMGLGYLFRNCRFYIEVCGKKQILLECGVYSNESPDRIWLMQIPEKYKNDFIMLWGKAHKEDVEWNKEQMKKYDEDCEKRRINNTDKYKGFYKQCYKTLAKSVHPDEGGDTEAMKCLNQLKVMWEI